MASYRWRSRVVRRADLSPAKKPSNSSAKFARDLERAFPSAGESPSQLSDNFERTLSWAAADLHGCRRRQRADSVPVAREHLSLHHFRVSQRHALLRDHGRCRARRAQRPYRRAPHLTTE